MPAKLVQFVNVPMKSVPIDTYCPIVHEEEQPESPTVQHLAPMQARVANMPLPTGNVYDPDKLHDSHAVAPVLGEMVPAAHNTGARSGETQKEPAGHDVHTFEPEPAASCPVHAVIMVEEPRKVEPPREVVMLPTLHHVTQPEEPTLHCMLPAMAMPFVMVVGNPVPFVYLPGLQERHGALPFWACEYCPA